MELRFKNYRLYFFLSLILFIAALVWPWLDIIYGIVFFISTLSLIIGIELPTPDPSHSSITHYQYEARINWFNYVIAAVIIVAALLFVFIPLPRKALTALILWGICAYLLPFLAKKLQPKVAILLFTDYIHSQLPEIQVEKIQSAVMLLISQPDISVSTLAKRVGIEAEKSKQIIHYFTIYIQNNLIDRREGDNTEDKEDIK
jgi:hypothetical protein